MKIFLNIMSVSQRILLVVGIGTLLASGSLAEETVLNSKGQSILLKDDNTWVLLDTSSLDNKVVFTITNAVDTVFNYEMEDDYGDMYFSNWAGCKYVINVENRTKHKAKIMTFVIGTDYRPKDSTIDQDPGGFNTAMFDEVVMPGDNVDYYESLTIYGGINHNKTTEMPTKDQESKFLESTGCDAQRKGALYIQSIELDYGDPFVVFSKDSGISRKAVKNYVAGNPDGFFPLEEKIRF